MKKTTRSNKKLAGVGFTVRLVPDTQNKIRGFSNPFASVNFHRGAAFVMVVVLACYSFAGVFNPKALADDSQANLSISETVNNSTPSEGGNVTFTVTVSNSGVADATNVVVSDSLPAGLSIAGSIPSLGTDFEGSTWTIGTLANGSSASLQIFAQVNSETACSSITNAATISADNDSNATTSSSATINVQGDSCAGPTSTPTPTGVTSPSVDLSVTKTVDNATPNFGDTVKFTITITNNSGTVQASNVIVSDLIPAGLTIQGALTNVGGAYCGNTDCATPTLAAGEWAVGNIDPGATAVLTVYASVDNNAPCSITNTATIQSADQTDLNSGNNTASVTIDPQGKNCVNNVNVLDPDLSITKTVNNSTPSVGDTVKFTITITNTSEDNDATNVIAEDLIPAGLTIEGAITNVGGEYCGNADCATPSLSAGEWTVGTVAAGKSQTLVVYTSVDQDQSCSAITNTASITSADQPDSNSANNTASATVNVNGENCGGGTNPTPTPTPTACPTDVSCPTPTPSVTPSPSPTPTPTSTPSPTPTCGEDCGGGGSSTGTLIVQKIVVGGTATSSDFSLHVMSGDSEVAGSPQPGSASGTPYTLSGGSYVVSENSNAAYTATFSGACDANGNVNVVNGSTATCVVTNTEIGMCKAPVNFELDSGTGTLTAGWTAVSPSSTPLNYSLYSGNGVLTNSLAAKTVIPPWVSPSSSAIWISTSLSHPGEVGGEDQGSPSQDQWRLFQDSFTVPTGASITPVTLYFTADNAATVYLNGIEFASTTDLGTFDPAIPNPPAVFSQIYSVTFTPFVGVNTLNFVVRNEGGDYTDNPTALLYRVVYQEQDGCGGSGSGSNAQLNVTISNGENDGQGAVTGNGIECDDQNSTSSVCSAIYPVGTAITLTATPHTGSSFTGTWTTGPCAGSDVTTCSFTIASSTSVNAHFTLLPNATPTSGGGGGGGGNGGGGGGGGGSCVAGSCPQFAGGGGGVSGPVTVVPTGQVLGASTNTPSGNNGSVLGADTTLPRTGMPVGEMLMLMFGLCFVLARKLKLV